MGTQAPSETGSPQPDQPIDGPEDAPDMPDTSARTLTWVALYLTELAWGGHEEGAWGFEESRLVTNPHIYADVGMLPDCCRSDVEAEQIAEQMRAGLPALNEGRPALSSVLSRGLFEVKIIRADTLPHRIPQRRPRYE